MEACFHHKTTHATTPSTRQPQKQKDVALTEQEQQQQLLQQQEEGGGEQLKDGQDMTGLAKVVYRYFLEGWYTCKDPQSSPYKDRCEYWQYYLDSIIVRITRQLLSQ